MVSSIVAQTHHKSNKSDQPLLHKAVEADQHPDHQVVLSGVDTLTITAGGICSPSDMVLQQFEIWNQYQQEHENNEEFSTIEINGEWWELYPYSSRHYKYQFLNREIGFIKLFNPEKWNSGVAGKQQVHITFYPKFLHRYSGDDLYNQMSGVPGLMNTIDMLDVTVDDVRLDSTMDTLDAINKVHRLKPKPPASRIEGYIDGKKPESLLKQIGNWFNKKLSE